MSAELLTPENIADASRLGEENPYFSHPVLQVLREEGSRMERAFRLYTGPKNLYRAENSIKINYVEIAVPMGKTKDFSLDPLELIAVWAHVEQHHAYYPIFAPLLVLSYVGKGYHPKNNPLDSTWGQALPLRYLQSGCLPSYATEEPEGLLHIRKRLIDIEKSLTGIGSYTEGQGSTPLLDSLVRNLWPAVLVFDQEVLTILRRKQLGY